MGFALSLSVCRPFVPPFSTCLWLFLPLFFLIRLTFVFVLPLSFVYCPPSPFFPALSTLLPPFFPSLSPVTSPTVLVSKRARGSAFFGPQGVEAAGATKNLERALSFSLLELVAKEGELVDKYVEVEAEEDAPPDTWAEEDTPLDEAEEDTGVRQTSKVTGDCGTMAENCSESEGSGPFEVKGEVDVGEVSG